MIDNVLMVGRNTASLGEMIQQLKPYDVDVPRGDGVGSKAYDAVLDQNNLQEQLTEMLEGLDGKSLLLFFRFH